MRQGRRSEKHEGACDRVSTGGDKQGALQDKTNIVLGPVVVSSFCYGLLYYGR